PFASVVIVCAEIGPADSAKPVISDVMTKPRRDQLVRDSITFSSGARSSVKPSISYLPWFLRAREDRRRWTAAKALFAGRKRSVQPPWRASAAASPRRFSRRISGDSLPLGVPLRNASSPPFFSIVRIAVVLRRSRTGPSASESSDSVCRLGRKRRFVLMLEWLTLWPTCTPLPVTGHLRAMGHLARQQP